MLVLRLPGQEDATMSVDAHATRPASEREQPDRGERRGRNCCSWNISLSIPPIPSHRASLPLLRSLLCCCSGWLLHPGASLLGCYWTALLGYWTILDNWGEKAKRRRTEGTGRMSYLKDIPRRAKNGFRENQQAPARRIGVAKKK